MRVFLIALCACGAASSRPAAPPHARRVTPKPAVETAAPIDLIDALAQPLAESSWIVPGPAQLVLGGAGVQAIDGAPRLEVSVLEEQGSDIRVGVRLDDVRFALWMPRSRLLAIIAREQRVTVPGMPVAIGGEPMQVVLSGGAQVERLAHERGTTRIRYVGALEVEGWVPDDALTDRAPAGRHRVGRIAIGKKPLMLVPGAVIRAEPKWAGAQLAVLNQGYFVDELRPIDDAWSEVGYRDGDLEVHGYVSRRDPPGRTHRRRPSEASTPATPNATVADGTCLRVGGEEVGFIVGDRELVVEKTARVGWYSVIVDSPWGPLAFDAKGSTETELAKCGG